MTPNHLSIGFYDGTGAIICQLPWMGTVFLIFTSTIFANFGLGLLFCFAFGVRISNGLKTGIGMIMGGVTNEFVFFLDDSMLNIAAYFLPFVSAPQSILGHDLIKLLNFTQTRNAFVPIALVNIIRDKTANSGKGKIRRQKIMDNFRLRSESH